MNVRFWGRGIADMNITRDIEFKNIGDRRLLLDVYMPDGAAGRVPVIVWICGGGWAQMSKEAAEEMWR